MDDDTVREIKERERKFREQDVTFEKHTIASKTKWWNTIEIGNVIRYLNVKDGENILDVGCSDGRILECIHKTHPQCKLFGIDFARKPLKVLKDKGFQSYVVCGDAGVMPFKPGFIDRAASVQLIQQIPSRNERVKTLKCIHTVLKEQGTLVVTVLNQRNWSHLVANGQEGPLLTAKDLHVFLYNPESLTKELEEAGFRVQSIRGTNNVSASYLKRLGPLGVTLDMLITNLLKPLSLKKGCYLLASCIKK